jgi:hypothetical protein
MKTKIVVRRDRLISEVQKDFSDVFPYLKIDFYKVNTKGKFNTAEKLDKAASLKNAPIFQEGEIPLHDSMTVLQLERLFREQFGAYVQVSRKSGSLWLETTMTDNWTLKQQNDHGRELSEPAPKIEDEIDYQ